MNTRLSPPNFATLCAIATFLACSAVAVPVAQAQTSAAPAPMVSVRLEAVDAPNIRVEYPVLADCAFMAFSDARAIVHQRLRSTWTKAANACGALTPQGISTEGCMPGQAVVIEVPNVATVMDDPIYPTATPLRGVGTLLHTGALRVNGKCGPVALGFFPPTGGAVTAAGAEFAASVIRGAEAAPAFVFLGGPTYAKDKPRTSFDADFPAAARSELAALVDQIRKAYQGNDPQLVAPHVFVGYHDQPKGFGASFSGNVSQDKRLLGLSFYKESPIPISDTFEAARFVAHEFAHTTQPNTTRASEPNWTTIFEGNAETIALLTLAKLNPAWRPKIADRIEGAINRCLQEVGPSVWRASARSGRIPYDCGVAFTVASVLAWQKNSPALPLEILLANNRQPRTTAAGLWHSQVAALVAGPDTLQSWLPSLLADITRADSTSAIVPLRLDASPLFAERVQ